MQFRRRSARPSASKVVENDAPGFDTAQAVATLSYALTRFMNVGVTYSYYHQRFDEGAVLSVGVAGFRRAAQRSRDGQSVGAALSADEEGLMLPGKKYKPEDYLRMAWRRKWLIVIPAVLAGAGTFAWSSQLPDRYSASTTILVVPQRVPESYVRSTVTAGRRGAAADHQPADPEPHAPRAHHRGVQPVPGRARDDDHGRRRRADAHARHQSRRRQPEAAQRGREHFSVSFESSQPRTAMQVAERLASMFVAGEPAGPRGAGRYHQSVPAGAARGCPASLDRARSEARSVPPAQLRTAAAAGRSRTCR